VIDYGAGSTLNMFDNIENEEDTIVIFVEMFASNDGTSLSVQVCLAPGRIVTFYECLS
jgi:hypothetical protein